VPSTAPGGPGALSLSGQSWMSFSVEADLASVALDWVSWLLAGAVGGFVALLSVAAAGGAYRRRFRALGPERPPSVRTMSLVDSAAPATPGSAPGADASAGPSPPSRRSVLIGYVTEAADGDVGAGDRSARAIETAREGSGWELLEIVRDPDKGAPLDRPELRNALERILGGEAQGLVMADLERLSRSLVDLGALLTWFRDARATLVALDLGLDTSTPEGRHVANTLIALSARQHERIASATRRGLAKRRASGRPTGRPAVSHRPELVERIADMRAANMTLRAIAEQLNAEGVPTLRGGKKWRPSSIQGALGYRRPDPRDHLPSPSARAGP
jgi:DNA invertase Pin-like site-specific DNA recombinase